eukprot:365831-Chlamydomonas_euryale.AAC.9
MPCPACPCPQHGWWLQVSRPVMPQDDADSLPTRPCLLAPTHLPKALRCAADTRHPTAPSKDWRRRAHAPPQPRLPPQVLHLALPSWRPLPPLPQLPASLPPADKAPACRAQLSARHRSQPAPAAPHTLRTARRRASPAPPHPRPQPSRAPRPPRQRAPFLSAARPAAGAARGTRPTAGLLLAGMPAPPGGAAGTRPRSHAPASAASAARKRGRPGQGPPPRWQAL